MEKNLVQERRFMTVREFEEEYGRDIREIRQ